MPTPFLLLMPYLAIFLNVLLMYIILYKWRNDIRTGFLGSLSTEDLKAKRGRKWWKSETATIYIKCRTKNTKCEMHVSCLNPSPKMRFWIANFYYLTSSANLIEYKFLFFFSSLRFPNYTYLNAQLSAKHWNWIKGTEVKHFIHK